MSKGTGFLPSLHPLIEHLWGCAAAGVRVRRTCVVVGLPGCAADPPPVPLATAANLREPFTDDEVSIFYRKIDNGSDLVMANPTNGDIFICGKDKILKKYEYPTDKFKGIDFKKAPNAPI